MNLQSHLRVSFPAGLFAVFMAVSAFQSGCVVEERRPHHEVIVGKGLLLRLLRWWSRRRRQPRW